MDRNEIKPRYPLTPRPHIITHDDLSSEEDCSEEDDDDDRPWKDAGYLAVRTPSNTTNVSIQSAVQTKSNTENLSTQTVSRETRLFDSEFTDYHRKISDLTLECVATRKELEKLKQEEGWSKTKEKQKLHDLYKVISRKLELEMQREFCNWTKDNLLLQRLLMRCRFYMDEQWDGCEFERYLQNRLKNKQTPWKVQLGLLDELRQIKRVIRKDCGLKRPLFTRCKDYITHKVTKTFCSTKYDFYKKI